ncbi:hypothetical protein E2C01_030403 [Portunus trituberculatus]|uniref:PAS domain-containing protein n=1 Tax=Portunus trituberculatus TaxID=210409 RepID=A0A5B7EX80_PORTR|nr:hypothetical protein [Portunus trituberculatus]
MEHRAPLSPGVLHVSAACLKFSGCDVEEVRGERFSSLMRPLGREGSKYERERERIVSGSRFCNRSKCM